MTFPDATRPIATCSETDCEGCQVAPDIHCHFRREDLLHFLLASLPAFLVAGVGLLFLGVWPLVAWVGIVIGFFGFLEIRVMCSHCPHYAEEGRTLSCWANHGSPKIWKYRPGPMSRTETLLFFGGLAAVWAYPTLLLALGEQWVLWAVFVLLSVGFFAWLKTVLCPRCMNFACPLNAAGAEARRRFFLRNPSVAEHWTQKGDTRGATS